VQSIAVHEGGTSFEQLDYGYDAVLNVDTLTDSDGLHDYGYDGLDRLTQALHPGGSGLPGSEDFGYDGVGNREDPGDPAAYGYDANNRITTSPGLTYTFDDDGNTLSRSDGATFSYDAGNRLTGYSQGGTTASYRYDPLGRRIKKTVDGQTTWFVWDGTRLLGEYDNSGSRLKRYAYLPGDYLPIQMADDDGTYNVHGDHLETPRLLTDPTQSTNKKVVWRGTFEAFGTGVIDESPAPGPKTVNFNLRFPGQYYDEESGLSYNYFRYYDPETGRYVTADPIGQLGGINVYLYALNDPINLIDPYGQYVPIITPIINIVRTIITNPKVRNATIGALMRLMTSQRGPKPPEMPPRQPTKVEQPKNQNSHKSQSSQNSGEPCP